MTLDEYFEIDTLCELEGISYQGAKKKLCPPIGEPVQNLIQTLALVYGTSFEEGCRITRPVRELNEVQAYKDCFRDYRRNK